MNYNINYYKILGVDKTSTDKEIKKAYYKLSFEYHPDRNKDVNISLFNEITEAYNILCSESREDYDTKSKFGNNYNEYYELFRSDYEFDYNKGKEHYERFKKYEVNNIYITVDDDFDGTLEYERFIRCKSCDGTGKDTNSKIVIKDNNGNIIKTFESEDGCDFCEGTGKDYKDDSCSFCKGVGKIGLVDCNTCKGEKRILGKQKLKGIKLTGDTTKIEAMGNYTKDSIGQVGHLILKKSNNKEKE